MARLVCGNVIKIKHSSYHVLWKNDTSRGPDTRTVETHCLTLLPCIRLQKRHWSLAVHKLPMSEQDRKAGEIQIHLCASSTLQYNNSRHGNGFSPPQCFYLSFCSLNRLIRSLLSAFTEFRSLLQACTGTVPPTKNFRNGSRAQHVDFSSQMKTMHFFNIKTCIDKRRKRTGSTSTHCELGCKLFFKTITTKND